MCFMIQVLFVPTFLNQDFKDFLFFLSPVLVLLLPTFYTTKVESLMLAQNKKADVPIANVYIDMYTWDNNQNVVKQYYKNNI